MNIPELLAPAANTECARAAFEHGADAVYIGYDMHNLRAHSSKVMSHDLQEILSEAHDVHKKVYVALNVMPNDAMIAGIESSLKAISIFDDKPDAIIVSDPGVVALCSQHLPSVNLHLSTQTGTFNTASADFWKAHGVTRVILPRELSLAQIAYISEYALVETEVFVHGAMCMSVSGRCLMGAYMGGRHPNFGDCPQPCRYKYRISPLPVKEDESAENWFTVEEDSEAFLFNSKDLNALSILDKIVNTGVASVKIEGRNRSYHYVSSVVKIYREALDSLVASPQTYRALPHWLDELDRLDHRPYTTGFYGNEYQLQDVRDMRPVRDVRVVGVVRAIMPDKRAVVDVKNPFSSGDILSVLPQKKKAAPFDTHVLGCTDFSGINLHRALTNRLVIIETELLLGIGDIVRKHEQ